VTVTPEFEPGPGPARRPGPARVELPALPTAQPPAGFPLLATIAPVGVSVAIWAVTGSVFALLFAALGPVVALASLVDGRRQRRRRRLSDRRRFLAAAEVAFREIDELHAVERANLLEVARSASAILERVHHDPDRWGATDPGSVRLTLGRGRIESALQVDGEPGRRASDDRGAADPGGPDLVAVARQLADRAAWLDAAPVDARGIDGIGIVGTSALTAPIARGYVLQLAGLLSPGSWRIDHSEPGQRWISELPHSSAVVPAARGAGTIARFRRESGTREPDQLVIATGRDRDSLPPGVRVVIEAGAGARISRHPDPGRVGPVEVETVAAVQASAAARWLAEVAAHDGHRPPADTLAHTVSLGDLLGDVHTMGTERVADNGKVPRRDRATLRCRFLVAAAGPLDLDLVTDGPHAVIGGTTGSGKSELLISWVLALASTYPPRLVSVLLVDFKGGASFAALEAIPHCVGVISDLDEGTALRALASLRAELRYRERTLAEAGARSIDELDGEHVLPRLVIVVDEFAAMVAGFPELHGLFADIAARGRSLGVHLVLATQRPAGVVRDAVLANSGLRMSLRVNNRADSSVVVGSDAAATLPAGIHGRALVSVAGSEPVTVQVALAGESAAVEVARRWTGTPGSTPRRPWLEPLPALVPLSQLEGHSPPGSASERSPALPFALADRPDEQSQPAVVFDPASDGHLLVLGGPRSGKSTLTRVLESQGRGRMSSPLRVPVQVEDAWDVLAACAALARAGGGDGVGGAGAGAIDARLVIIDDIDVLLARFTDEYQPAVVENISVLVREGARAGLTAVITAQRIPPVLGTVFAACEARLVLRQASKQDFLVAGGSGEHFVPGLPAGAGHWRTATGWDRVQVAMPARGSDIGEGAAMPDPAMPTAMTLDPASSSLLIVSSRPAESAERVRGLLSERPGRVVELRAGAGSANDARALVVSAGQEPVIVIGDADAWHSHWGALSSLGSTVPVVYERCSIADYRALSRSRELPPPVSRALASTLFTVVLPDGSVARARWGVSGLGE